VADDDRAVLERLAALEAEVKADADAQRARKEAALAKLRDQHVTQTAERKGVRTRQAELVKKRTSGEHSTSERAGERGVDHVGRHGGHVEDHLEDLGGALELASKANRVKKELQRPRKKGEKSWLISGALSFTGPFGWLYAGSWREAVPATAAWMLVLALVSKLWFLMPVFMIALPLSAIAGVVYALQYNRAGSRQRLFGDSDEKPKQLPG
jgi:hypothetical protein